MASNSPRLSKLELRIMDVLWSRGSAPVAIREIQEAFPELDRPAYTTIQTTVYRMEEKGALRRVRKIGNAHLFEPLVDRESARGNLIDDILNLFGGRTQPMMAHLVETGKLTMADVREAEKLLNDLEEKKGGSKQ
jgi:BlaI family penicillinase repressor